MSDHILYECFECVMYKVILIRGSWSEQILPCQGASMLNGSMGNWLIIMHSVMTAILSINIGPTEHLKPDGPTTSSLLQMINLRLYLNSGN